MNYPYESPEEFRARREAGHPSREEELLIPEEADDSWEAYEPDLDGGFI